MTDTKHTPSPWRVGSRYGNLLTEITNEDGGKCLALVFTHKHGGWIGDGRSNVVPDPEGQANAALIAAMPALQEVFASLLTICMPAVSHTDCDAKTLIARTPQAIENVSVDVEAYISTMEKRRLLLKACETLIAACYEQASTTGITEYLRTALEEAEDIVAQAKGEA